MHWNNAARQNITNAVFATYSIPVEVRPVSMVNVATDWKVNVLGGTMETTLELIHKKQDRIVENFKRGLGYISKSDALFMYTSQWLEWMVVNGEKHPDHEEMVELMEGWLVLYKTLNNLLS